VQWLRDGAKMIDSAEDIESLAASVPDNGGVYFVPANWFRTHHIGINIPEAQFWA
jgi:hypothetical protein